MLKIVRNVLALTLTIGASVSCLRNYQLRRAEQVLLHVAI